MCVHIGLQWQGQVVAVDLSAVIIINLLFDIEGQCTLMNI